MPQFAFDPRSVRSASREVDDLAAVVSAELMRRAVTAVAEGRLAEARSFFDAALQADPTPATSIRCAEFLAALGEWDAAEALLSGLLSVARTDPALRCAVCHNLAAIERERGNATAANSRQQASVAAALAVVPDPEAGSRRGSLDARDLIGLANDAVAQDDFPTAELLLDAARRRARTDVDLEALADVWGTRGAIALREGRIGRAIRDLTTAARLHRAANDRQGLGADLLNLAEAYRAQNRLAAARSLARRAAKHFGRCGALVLERRAAQAARDVSRMLAIRGGQPSWN